MSRKVRAKGRDFAYTGGMSENKTTAPQDYNPRRLHVVAFAEAGALLEDRTPLADFPRLHEANPQTFADTPLPWRAQGRTHKAEGSAAEIWLDLQAEVTLRLQCQRCLQPMEETVHVERTFRFVRDETTAARLDEEI
ncbi:MAG: hypothetical protein Q4G39_03185, partial [Brachymonas sp.]|nr:hypothetical protein [Brachymonas sp.]